MQPEKISLPENWHLFDDAERLAEKLANTILEIAEQAIAESGVFHFITAGGSTPNRCYQLLSQADADWSKWQVYMGDERVLPFVDSERNSQALLTHWISDIDIPVGNAHFINTEAGSEKSAQGYADLIDSVARFDLCLLGMGEDGHTASLFPGHQKSDSVELVSSQQNESMCSSIVIERNSPKPPAERVSLNYCAFSKCGLILKLITGASKQEAVKVWLQDGKELPVAVVQGQANQVWISKDALPEN
jgi:6-phosphogluconolactonase